MKLSKEENEKMIRIVNKYNDIHSQFSKVQNLLDEIHKQKDDLIVSLDNNRYDELAFFEELNKKYGDGKFDLNSFEYIKNN